MGSKEDLEHILKVSRQKQLESFCPLIRDTCRMDCICYNIGGIADNRVNEAFCANTLINSTVSINLI